jgi:hypothetical protein
VHPPSYHDAVTGEWQETFSVHGAAQHRRLTERATFDRELDEGMSALKASS